MGEFVGRCLARRLAGGVGLGPAAHSLLVSHVDGLVQCESQNLDNVGKRSGDGFVTCSVGGRPSYNAWSVQVQRAAVNEREEENTYFVPRTVRISAAPYSS